MRVNSSILSFLPASYLPSFLPFPLPPFLAFTDVLCHIWSQMSSIEERRITGLILILVIRDSSNSHSVFFVLWMFGEPRRAIWETGKEESQKKVFGFFSSYTISCLLFTHSSLLTFLQNYISWIYFLYQPWRFIICI